MTQTASKELTKSAQTAKAIRQLLKEKYPTIKFSVRSDNFSMGNSVDISWNLGPKEKEINYLVSKYQYGHFDGMIDMYEYSNCREDIPQAKFVQTSRDYKTEEELANDKIGYKKEGWRDLWHEEKSLYQIIAKELCAKMGIVYESLNQIVPDNFQHMARRCYGYNDLRDVINCLLYDKSLMTGYHGIKNVVEEGREISNSFEVF